MKTIKFYAVALAVLASVGFVNAQSYDLGIKAGGNFGSLRTSVDAVSGKSGKVGFHVGMFARLGNELYFQPELNFSTFGSEYTYALENYEAKFRQVNLPLMVGYKILNNDNLNFRVSLGPDFNYNLKKPDAPVGTSYKRFDYGGVLNAGVDVGRLTFDARYSLGLNKLNEELGQRTGMFALSIGFKFL